MRTFRLNSESAGLLIVDVQERLFDHVERSCEVMHAILKMARGAKILKLPIVATEQYPQGLGPTISQIKNCLGPEQIYPSKTCFSAVEKVADLPPTQWIIVGIEAHVCILQTAKDLQAAGKQVVVLNDAISSRSIYDFSTAIAEMRDCGIRISSVETVLFELMRDASHPLFKEMSKLLKG